MLLKLILLLMWIRQIVSTSIFFSSPIYCLRKCYYLGQRIIIIFENSQINRLMNSLGNFILVSFRFSIFAKLANLESSRPVLAQDSRCVKIIITAFKSCREKVSLYFNSSKLFYLSRKIFYKLLLFSLKRTARLFILIIIISTVIPLLMRNQMSYWGLFLRIIILFLSLSCLSGKINLKDLIESSNFIKWLGKLKFSE